MNYALPSQETYVGSQELHANGRDAVEMSVLLSTIFFLAVRECLLLSN